MSKQGSVPEQEQVDGWEQVRLADVATKRAENVDPRETEIKRHVGLKHIEPNTPTPSWESVENVTSTKRRFYSGDILFAKLRPNLEKAAHPQFGGVCSTDIFTIDAGKGINSKYLLYRLSSKPAFDWARRTSVGTRMPRTSWEQFRNFEFGLPPLKEQRRITSILCNLDRGISNVEEEIDKVRRIKRGTSRKLFSEGTREHSSFISGKWRNRSEEIPEKWHVLPADGIMTVTRGAHPRPKSDSTLWGGEIPIIKIGDRGERPVINTTQDSVTEKGSKKSKLVNEGAMIVSNAGTTGVPRIVGMTACIHDHWLILKDYQDRLDTRFLYHYLDWNTNYVQTLASGSTVADLNTTDFGSFEIVVPSLDEQKEIATILDDFDALVFKNQEIQAKLVKIKRALLQDLMSGSVRAHDESVGILDEVAQYE